MMKLQPEVLYHLSYYWWLRCALVPLTLLNMSLSGILQVIFHIPGYLRSCRTCI